MDVKQIRSVLLCITCIFLVSGNATEFSTDVLYEIFSRRMDDVMLEHKLLRLEFDEAVRSMGNQADRITNVEDAAKKMEKQADKIANFEEAINKIEEQTVKISSLEETTKRMEKQAERITSLEEAINKIVKQADKIVSLEETTIRVEKQADRITSLEEAFSTIKGQADKISTLEETTKRAEKQADRITSLEEAFSTIKEQADKIEHLEEVTNKMEKQVVRITKIEDIVKKMENKTKEVTNIENEVQHLNNKIEKLENNTSKNEKAISDVARLAMENDLKSVKASESSINAIKDNVMRQSIAVRKMVSAEKMFLRGMKTSHDEKLSNFTNEVKLQMTTLNASVESQISSFDTKTLQKKLDKALDHHTKTLETTNGEIQQLETRVVNVETRQGKRAAFTVRDASIHTDGILKFSKVILNEGSGLSTTTGQFTCPYPGIYGIIASILEGGSGNNFINCCIRKNGSTYVNIVSIQGKMEGKRATGGWGTATGATTFHLVKGDTVDLWCHSITGTSLSGTSFTGFLIRADP